ncbi:MAG: tRNA (adenosine(37)-N6)-dimethylallyltransferase MiaA [Pseudomonadota bacterium]
MPDQISETSGRTVFIAGPTAAGKTAAAIKLCARLAAAGRCAEIVNADAMQVYAEAPILTGQPSAQERAAAPHHLLGHLSGATRCSAGRWARDAGEVVQAIHARGADALIVGGTGLYFSALEGGLSEIPEIDAETRDAAAARLAELGPEAFRAEVLALDPAMARLQPNDVQRHLRAWAVATATGAPLSEWQAQKGARYVNDVAARIVLEPARETLYAQAEARFDAMLAAGALGEAEAVADLFFPADAPLLRALGLAELLAHLRREMTIDEASERAKRNTRRFIKRQLTWFRNQAPDWPRAADGNAAASDLAAMLVGSAGD